MNGACANPPSTSLSAAGTTTPSRTSAAANTVLLSDKAADRDLIGCTLASLAGRVTFAETVVEAVALAQRDDCDLIFASLNLKNEDGLQICPQLRTRESTRQSPILLLANNGDIARVAK